MFNRGGAPTPATTRSAIGLAVAVFAGVALSGPGRVDIVDGQTRYEVSRSIVDHGDSVIRNPEVWFGVFPGRNGQRYTYYRFPQSLAGVAAVSSPLMRKARRSSPSNTSQTQAMVVLSLTTLAAR